MVAEQIGARLRAARLRARYSALQAAQACRVRYAKLLTWEAGGDHPSADELGRLARLLGMAPDRLVPPAVLAMWQIDPAAVWRAHETADLGEWREPSRKRRLEEPPSGRLLPLRCDACGRWFSKRPCAHGRPQSA